MSSERRKKACLPFYRSRTEEKKKIVYTLSNASRQDKTLTYEFDEVDYRMYCNFLFSLKIKSIFSTKHKDLIVMM